MTQSKLKEELEYNPLDGSFIRLKSRGNQHGGSTINSKPNRNGYIDIRVHGLEEAGQSKKYKAHRLAWLYMTGSFPKHDIDHIDHSRANNKWDNLREVTKQENAKNRSVNYSSPSGVLGVTWHKGLFRWEVSLGGKYRGCFNDFHDAVDHRKKCIEEDGTYHKNHGT